MNKSLLTLSLLCALTGALHAQTPIVDSWIKNNTGTTAKYYKTDGSIMNTGELADISQVCYSSDSVWVRSTGMPSIFGPWTNPGSPSDQDFIYRFPKNPVAAASNQLVDVPLVFTVGALLNGAPIFGNGDARSYKSSTNTNVSNGDGKWNGNAYYTEGATLDSTYAGHVNQDGTYHSHATPFKFYKNLPTNQHSPIVGFAFDGYPVYGPFGYTDPTDNTSAIKRIKSSYRLRSISTRTTLPDGTTSTPAGPTVSGTFPLGMYIEDYEYSAGLGDLDEHNGRYCITPEYPSGTYAYFVTTEDDGDPAFPYYFGETYYGKPDQGNLAGPSVSITVPSSGTSCSATPVKDAVELQFSLSPNPVNSKLYIQAGTISGNELVETTITNAVGEVIQKSSGEVASEVDVTDLTPGLYHITFYNTSTGAMETQKFVKQ